ncbi:YdcF family protein [Neosynechococcus sphagnicola]|uniref:YdcF family protein n=1 Tax=Neosynechococcus sphagnicola TaxID=1501145 RepID=UPI00068D0AFF|nr:YdcF family protein [Neosynechococcus sphagnicola]
MQWTDVTWRLFHGLTHPWLIVPPLLVLMGLPWLLRSRPLQIYLSRPAAIALLFYLLAIATPTATLANWLLAQFVPFDTGAPADAIVVLGRGEVLRPSRIQTSVQLWQAHRAPEIFVSGAGDAPKMITDLQTAGVPVQQLSGEYCSRTTEENARYTAALLQPQEIYHIVLITDAPHMLRSYLTFVSFGFQVIPHPSPFPTHRSLSSLLVLREYVGLVSYGLLGRFQARETPLGLPGINHCQL